VLFGRSGVSPAAWRAGKLSPALLSGLSEKLARSADLAGYFPRIQDHTGRATFRLSAARAELGTALPSGGASTCYEMLRFSVAAEIWLAWFSTQVNIRSVLTSISLLTLVGNTCRLNSILMQELRRYGLRSIFSQKSPSRALFGAFYPPAHISAESGSSPLRIHWPLTTGHCSRATVLPPHAPRRQNQRVQAGYRPFPAGYCLTPTGQLSKTERDRISTSGPAISVCAEPGSFCGQFQPFFVHGSSVPSTFD